MGSPVDGGGYRLAWSDEFDGARGTPPGRETWQAETGGSGWGTQELQYYTGEPGNAAPRSLARTWTAELAGRGIRVNLISPGPIDTATFDGIPDQVRSAIAAMVPAARFGTSEEIAAAVLFLASADSSFIHGTELAVDGGLS